MQEMNDTEFLRMVGQLYEYALSRENDDDYILNMPQYLKLVEAQAFFTRLAEANDGTVETVRLSPRERCAGLGHWRGLHAHELHGAPGHFGVHPHRLGKGHQLF